MGFSRNQNAPRSCMVATAVSMLPKAVTTMAGGPPPWADRRRSSSNPSIRGIIRSVTRTCAGKTLSLSSASCPSAAVSAVKPQAATMLASPTR